MKIKYCTDYEEMSLKAAGSILSDLRERKHQRICTATGNSPIGIYEALVREYKKSPVLFEQLSIVKLDEWGGIPMGSPNSCETFVQEKILRPMEIPDERYISFNSDTRDPVRECGRVRAEVDQISIDTCILGLGRNGHIGFNEPAQVQEPYCHVARLSKASQGHKMVGDLAEKPIYGLTLGMADIIRSKKIVILITGEGKQKVTKELLRAKIDPQLPASFLWLHPDVECYVDSSSFQHSLEE